MPRIGMNDVHNYSTSGGGFFSLKNDKDMAVVRFMYNDERDIGAYFVHQVVLKDGSRRYVNCLREYNEPIDKCPLCEARLPSTNGKVKYFLPLYNVDTEEVQIWERGTTFGPKLESLCSRYAKDSALVSTPFEIERHGKKGDTSTTYETFACDTDDITLKDLPEVPEILGGIILNKTADEMVTFIETNEFPEELPKTKSRTSEKRRTPAATTSRRSSRTSEPSAPTRRRPTKTEEEEEDF